MTRSKDRFLLLVLHLATRRPRTVLIGWVVLLLALMPGVLRLEISTSTDDVLDRSSPEWSFYQRSVRVFGGDEVIVAALPSELAFDPAVIRQIPKLTRELEAVPGVRRVDSLATVPLVRVDASGSLDLSPALAEVLPGDPAELDALRRRIRADRIAPETLLSADERVFAINVQLQTAPEGGFDAVVSRVRRVVESHGAWVSGVPVFRAEINRTAGLEISKFVLLTVLIVGCLLYVLVGSLQGVAVSLGVGAVGTFVTLGGLGATDTALTLITVILPSLMLALGCAYSMHLISAARGAASTAALEAQLSAAFEPTALSGLTTAIGFLAVGSVRIDAIAQLGAYGALGVFFVVAAALTVVPAVLALRPLPVATPRFENWLRTDLSAWVFELSRRRGGLMVVLWLLMSGLCAFGFTRINVETDATRWFAPGSEVRDSYERIRERLAGISPMNFVIHSSRGVVTEPRTLAAIDGLAAYLNGLPEMGKAIAVTDPLRQLHAAFSGETNGSLPASQDLVEQYLLLLESTAYLPDLLALDRKSANVAMRLDDNGSESLLGVAARAEEWWQHNGPADTEARATGIMFEFARAEDEIALGQLRGFSWALVVVVGLMFAVYRTARLAALAIIPDVLPFIIVFGFLGLAGIPVDAGIVVSGSLILGMSIDDTLHMVSSWQEKVRAGENPEAALRSALHQVLAPVVLTTIVIGFGFSVLFFASFAFVKNLGILVIVEMLVCLLGDVIFLPPLLLRFGLPRVR